jgi:hypothetical protein
MPARMRHQSGLRSKCTDCTVVRSMYIV